MSNYRDDIQDTAVASDSTWLGLKSVVEDSAKITALLIFGLGVLHTDSAIASDLVVDRASHLTVDSAIVSDEVTGRLHRKDIVVSAARISDMQLVRLRVTQEDSAVASDLIIDKQFGLLTDSAKAGDELIGQRYASTIVTDSAQINGIPIHHTSSRIYDTAAISDLVLEKLEAKVLVEDTAIASGSILDSHTAKAPLLTSTARIIDKVIDQLHASDLVVDAAAIEGESIFSGGLHGQAWTANTETWAMSRYDPYTFSRLAVVDGKLYGLAEDGVYALSGGTEQIEGSVTTGKIDLGEGGLVHPTSAYLEYELEGTAEMDVTTTQSGLAQTFTYPLAAEVANELTNGRFIFGRGLRGRHFSFTLRIKGLAGYINDLSVTSTPTKRRV